MYKFNFKYVNFQESVYEDANFNNEKSEINSFFWSNPLTNRTSPNLSAKTNFGSSIPNDNHVNNVIAIPVSDSGTISTIENCDFALIDDCAAPVRPPRTKHLLKIPYREVLEFLLI